jgi:tRNA(fMet)-specific endonuclease VapC
LHGQFTISAVSRYQVIRGYKDVGASQALTRFLALCGQWQILPLTDAEFDRASDLWVLARRGGHPCQDADLLIAATAIESGCRLATGNTRHFAWIAGLLIDDWRQP